MAGRLQQAVGLGQALLPGHRLEALQAQHQQGSARRLFTALLLQLDLPLHIGGVAAYTTTLSSNTISPSATSSPSDIVS